MTWQPVVQGCWRCWLFALLVLARPVAAQVAPPPASVKALVKLAAVEASRNDTAGALDSLGKARRLAPNSEEVVSAFAEASLSAHEVVPAILALTSLTRVCPTEARYHYLTGIAWLEVGELERARAHLTAADRLAPDQPATLVALGRTLNGQAAYADARPYLARAFALDLDNVEALAALAQAEGFVGDIEAAESHARRALARSSDNLTANLAMGLVLMSHGRYADARDVLQRAVEADPSSAQAHYQLSVAFALTGDTVSSQREADLSRQRRNQIDLRVKSVRAQTATPAGKAP